MYEYIINYYFSLKRTKAAEKNDNLVHIFQMVSEPNFRISESRKQIQRRYELTR